MLNGDRTFLRSQAMGAAAHPQPAILTPPGVGEALVATGIAAYASAAVPPFGRHCARIASTVSISMSVSSSGMSGLSGAPARRQRAASAAS